MDHQNLLVFTELVDDQLFDLLHRLALLFLGCAIDNEPQQKSRHLLDVHVVIRGIKIILHPLTVLFHDVFSVSNVRVVPYLSTAHDGPQSCEFKFIQKPVPFAIPGIDGKILWADVHRKRWRLQALCHVDDFFKAWDSQGDVSLGNTRGVECVQGHLSRRLADRLGCDGPNHLSRMRQRFHKLLLDFAEERLKRVRGESVLSNDPFRRQGRTEVNFEQRGCVDLHLARDIVSSFHCPELVGQLSHLSHHMLWV